MKAALATAALALATALPASAAGPAGARAFSFTLEPGKVHEECLRLEAGRVRAWAWKSDRPLAFNIHFHRDGDVAYPVMREGTAVAEGRFVAKSGEDYCWMWTAGREGARVRGSLGAEE